MSEALSAKRPELQTDALTFKEARQQMLRVSNFWDWGCSRVQSSAIKN